MKLSVTAKRFLQGRGDKKVRKLIMKGGRKGAESDFDKVLKRASKPSPSSRKES